MKIKQDELIESLEKDVEILVECADFFRNEIDALLVQPMHDKWSVAQVLEHLDGYGRVYLPQIDNAIAASQSNRDAWFYSGDLVNDFTNMIKPKNVLEVKNKMKAFKTHSPANNLNPGKVLEEFVEQQHKLLQLLEMAKLRNLNSIRVPL